MFPKILFLSLLIGLDQPAKHLATSKICNQYISWGIPLSGIWLWFFLFLAIILLIFIATKTTLSYPLLLIFAGAISNIIDRLQTNCVIDFINLAHIPLINQISILNNFPIFNLADIFITIGTILFLWQEFFQKRTVSKKKNNC